MVCLPTGSFGFDSDPQLYDLQPSQGCALRKIEGNPVLWTCEIQCAQHMISMKKQRFSSRPSKKVRRHGPPGSARAQPCFLSWAFPICILGLNLLRTGTIIFSELDKPPPPSNGLKINKPAGGLNRGFAVLF